MKRVALALGLVVLASPAPAQNAITQEGSVLQNSPMMFRGNNRARQGAPVGGAPTGQIVNTGDAVVGGRCDYSAPTDAAGGYYKMCLDAATGKIVMGGTKNPQLGLTLEINGVTYSFPGSGNGNVVSPDPFPGAGYLAGWNGGSNIKSMYGAASGGNLIGTFTEGAPGSWGNHILHVGTQGHANNAVFSLDNNLPPAGLAFPTALAGYGRISTPAVGHMAFGIYGISELYAGTGTAIAAEFTARNFSGGAPDINLPPSTALPNAGRTINGVHVTCGTAGTNDCSIGTYISNETGNPVDKAFNTGLYISQAGYRQFGIVIDAPSAGNQTSALFKNNGTGYAAQLMMSGTPTGNAALIIDNATEGAQAAILYNGHMVAKQYKATGHGLVQPTIGACGAGPTVGVNATDMSGYVAVGTGVVASCAVTFGTAFLVAPACVATGLNIADFSITGITTTGFTVSGTGLAGSTFTYICMPQGG